MSCLLAVLLVLQVASPLHHGARAAAADEKAIALASLSAAIGQPATLCADDGDPSHPSDPSHAASCEHCIFCHALGSGLAATPVAAAVARFATPGATARPRTAVAFVRARHLGGATPRGPPAIG